MKVIMKIKQKRLLLSCGIAAGVFALAGLSPTQALAQAKPVVKIDGSSTVYPIMEAISEDFQKNKKGSIQATVGISGTGGGFKKFCRGEIDIGNASRPILKSEMEACAKEGVKYFEIPIAFDALTVVVNPKNTFVKQLTVAQLKMMWEPGAAGKITNWKQVDPSFPDTPLRLFGPGADSGTFDYFTEAVNGKSKASRGDFTASEDDNVLVQGVSRETGGLAYFGFPYYFENKSKLRAVPIVNKQGKTVEPSEAGVIDGSYNPLARPMFIYVNAASLAKPHVKEYIDYAMKNGARLTKEVKYVPLPAKAYEIGAEHIKKNRLGTVFKGSAEVGLTIDELMKREASL
jgi:phosphate transport system substrate-binding protein